MKEKCKFKQKQIQTQKLKTFFNVTLTQISSWTTDYIAIQNVNIGDLYHVTIIGNDSD